MANLNEDLKRYKQLLGYDPKIGGQSITEKRYHDYMSDDTDYAEGEEETEETETEGFGEEGGEETEGGDNPDFDFGGEGEEETEETETEEVEDEGDEFGTADEFSAADELETEDDGTEEIDVTDIVKRADDAKGSAERAVTAAEQGKNMIQDLMTKFDSLQQSLSKIDMVANELNIIKSDLQSQRPKEKLELRSLDSYPFNVKLTDYWDDEKLKDNYEITSRNPDGKSQDGSTKVWKLNPDDVKDYSATDIKKSFVPESRSKRKVLTEAALWDKIRDKWFELTYMAKSMGYTLSKIPDLYSLKKKGDEEGYDKLIIDIQNYAKALLEKHPNHQFKSELQKLMYDLEKLDDLTYNEFEKDPSKFSPHQQDILLGGMKLTDKGVERDRDHYRIKKEDYSTTDIKKSFVPESKQKRKKL
jgi:hypothetical protein